MDSLSACVVGTEVAALFPNQPAPAWTELGRVNFLPDLGLGAWVLWFVTALRRGSAGAGLAPRLHGGTRPDQQRAAAAVDGWHLPAFFYVPSYAAIGRASFPVSSSAF